MPDLKLVRILIIDDDADDRSLLAEMLGSIGSCDRHYQVHTAATYEEGLSQTLSHEHDVVLVDFQLDGYTGVDLLQATADDAMRPPMIVLTGHSNAEIDRRCLEAGASDYLVKSGLDRESLTRSLRYAVERRRLNLRLLERQREYRSLFEASPMPMWVYDPRSLRILEGNHAAITEYGYDRQEFLELRVSDLFSEDDRARFLAHEDPNGADMDSSGIGRAGTARNRRKNGELIDVELVRSDIRFGNNVAHLALAFNVSGRLRAENALRASESTLRQVLRDTADGLLVVGQQELILFANPAACHILGRTEDDLVGSAVPDALLGETRESVELRAGSDSPRFVDLRNGPTQWNEAAARLLMLHDVTERRVRTDQMQLLRRAVESSTDGLLIVDVRLEDQPLIYVNPAFETISGYHALECLGRNCRFLQGDDRDQVALDTVRAAIAAEVGCSVVLRNYRKDGALFWNRLSMSPVRQTGTQVTHYVAAMSDITAQKLLEAEHLFLASNDAVTGLPKFAGSEQRLNALMQRIRDADASGIEQRLVFLFFDLDSFNTINDTLGFASGDAALRQMAARLRSAAGESAEVLRYAGDEFLIVLEDIAIDADLHKLGTTYCELVAEPLVISSTVTLYLSASVGVSAYPDTGDEAIELIRQAEIATNRAKRSGRSGVFVFGHELQEALSDRKALGSRMRDALSRGEFVLHYQPQVNAQDGALSTVEALVRWDSPEFGLLPPRRFVPIAEDNGMILQLGAWVLRSACLQMRQWTDQGLQGFMVSVNVSAAQLQRSDFVADVRRTIEETGIDPGMLELELTESILVGNADRAVAQMNELKQLGIRLALDDFGMGYSSLSYLRLFPIDKLKIDQSFINNIVHEGKDAALVRAMISIGHHLGLRVVAEGVESAAQVGYLRRNHCDELQGFHFSRALPADQIPELVRRRYLIPSAPTDEYTRTLLLLDDEENIRRSLVRLLRRDGYHILEASNASEAFELLATHHVQVIVSDQRMPGMSGTEFLSQVKDMYPETVRMVLSGFTDLASVTDAINRGAIYKFLTKPWDDEALRAQVLEAFRRFEAPSGG